jgi:hypothetical protein
MLELALLLPVLLLLIAGIVEIVAYTIDYMAVLDASREAARYGTSLDPDLTSYHALDMRSCTDDSFCDCDESKGKCNAFPNVRPPGFEDGDMPPEDLVEICDKGNTTNFYYELGCLVVQNLPVGYLDPSVGDDVVISVIGVESGGDGDGNPFGITHRWPLSGAYDPNDPEGSGDKHLNDWEYHFPGDCWSLYGAETSIFDNAVILDRLEETAPDTGFVIVEVFHAHAHFTGFFTIGQFIPNPLGAWAYTVFPVPAAEPED